MSVSSHSEVVPPVFRRRFLALGAASLAVSALPACSLIVGEGRSYTVTAEELNQAIASEFPLRHELGQVAELSVENPRVVLLPQSQQARVTLDLVAAEGVTGRKLTGRMEVDSGVRWDSTEDAVRLEHVQVRRLVVDQLPPAQRLLVQRAAPALVEPLLEGLVVYRPPQSQVARARRFGLAFGGLEVESDSIRIDLVRRPPGS